jgi:hypothetical protein
MRRLTENKCSINFDTRKAYQTTTTRAASSRKTSKKKKNPYSIKREGGYKRPNIVFASFAPTFIPLSTT